MRIPTIIYSTHLITTLIPNIYSILLDDFSKMNRVGPETLEERLKLLSLYIPFIVIPALMLLTMLVSDTYKCVKTTSTSSSAQSKSKDKKNKHFTSKKQQ